MPSWSEYTFVLFIGAGGEFYNDLAVRATATDVAGRTQYFELKFAIIAFFR